jgi:hypothetical protein
VGWWLPTHYQVKLQLQLRLSWAVTIIPVMDRLLLGTLQYVDEINFQDGLRNWQAQAQFQV